MRLYTIALAVTMCATAVATAAVTAKSTSRVAPLGYQHEQCNLLIDYMSQQISKYELKLRAMKRENDALRNELEEENT